MFTLLAGQVAWAAAPDAAALYPRALVAQGNTARLQQALAKARRGERVVVAVIGGSITQGASAGKPENRYGNRVADWWRRAFPQATIEFVNAGIGATGSNYGALRARRDLLAPRPDVVVVEYAVNDANGQPQAETLEGLVRQILGQPNRPAALLLFMMNQAGGNAQEWHSKVGAHYALPMLSYRDALWPEIEAGRLKWTDISPDTVHPNDLGHEFAASLVTRLLQGTLDRLPADNDLPAVGAVPLPLFSDALEHVALLEGADLKPARWEGWELDEKTRSWRSDAPGSTFEAQVEGRRVYLSHWRIRGGMGRARAQVDDRPPIALEGWFDQTWGGYWLTVTLAEGLAPGPHRVRVELLDEKHAESTGYEFKIRGIGAAGL